jgi:hypothetical protein
MYRFVGIIIISDLLAAFEDDQFDIELYHMTAFR